MTGTINIRRLERGLYSISAGYYSKALTEAAKAIPGIRYDSQLGWYGYADAIECVRNQLTEKGIRVDGELPKPDAWKNGALTLLVATNGIKNLKLRPYQQEGVKFAVSMATEGCLIADGMRLGKTAQSTVTARAFNEKTLVVCPPHVTGVWSRPPSHPKPGEIAKWWPAAWRGVDGQSTDGGKSDPYPGVVQLEGVEPFIWQQKFRELSEIKEDKRTPEQAQELREADAILSDLGKDLQNAFVVVVHDAIVYAWVEILLRWGARTLIIDEIHNFSSYDARRSIAVKELARVAVRRIGLSGTPMTNRPRDLHNVADILCPSRFGVFFRHEGSSFAKSFCDSHQKTVGTGPEAKTVWDHDGSSNHELLNRRLSYFMLRRVAREVDDQLPEKQRQIIDVKVPSAKTVMPSMEVLKNKEHLRRLLDLAADGKLKSVIDLIKTHVDEGEKVVVFCHRQVFAEAIINSLKMTKGPGLKSCGTSFVHGDVDTQRREERIHEAENWKGPYVFACTIESCSTGIDLSFASVAIFAELIWIPSGLAQAEDRLYVVGSGKKLLIQYVIARGTGDELILRSVISKLDDFEKIVGVTDDNMKRDLGKKSEKPADALERLANALMHMHDEKPKARSFL